MDDCRGGDEARLAVVWIKTQLEQNKVEMIGTEGADISNTTIYALTIFDMTN